MGAGPPGVSAKGDHVPALGPLNDVDPGHLFPF